MQSQFKSNVMQVPVKRRVVGHWGMESIKTDKAIVLQCPAKLFYMSMRYTVCEVKMNTTIPGYSKGRGWEIRDDVKKIVLDVKPTEKAAKSLAIMQHLTNSVQELSFAIEGKYTNLRVWRTGETIFMRLDKFEAYSAPLSPDSIAYLNKPLPTGLNKFGFETPIDKVSELSDILSTLKERQCKAW